MHKCRIDSPVEMESTQSGHLGSTPTAAVLLIILQEPSTQMPVLQTLGGGYKLFECPEKQHLSLAAIPCRMHQISFDL